VILRLLWGALALVVIALAAWIIFLQTGRMFAIQQCPACFGFERVGDNAYSSDGARHEVVLATIAQARRRLKTWYGRPRSVPVFFVCADAICARRTVAGHGRPLGLSGFGRTILLLPGGGDAAIAAHEWSHVEFKERLGVWNFFRAEVPAWFDEGLAVIVADDRRYLDPAVQMMQCARRDILPVDEGSWGRLAATDHMLYAVAACRVWTWLDSHDGQAGLLRMIAAMKAGKSFVGSWNAP
jgi:hypothetical protein